MLSTSLKMFRSQYHLTQKQIADSLSIDRSTYSYYETGKSYPTLETLVRLAKIFDTSTDVLLGIEPITFNEGAPIYNRSGMSTSVAALTDEEQNIIINYRQLPENLKKQVVSYVEDCLDKTTK